MAYLYAKAHICRGGGDNETVIDMVQNTIPDPDHAGPFGNLVKERVIQYRRAENLKQLKPPTEVDLELSVRSDKMMSAKLQGNTGWRSVDVESMPRREIPRIVSSKIGGFAAAIASIPKLRESLYH